MRGNTRLKYLWNNAELCSSINSCFGRYRPIGCRVIGLTYHHAHSHPVHTQIPPSPTVSTTSIPSTLQSSTKSTINKTTWGNTHAQTHIQSILQYQQLTTIRFFLLQCYRGKHMTVTTSWLYTVLPLFLCFYNNGFLTLLNTVHNNTTW